MGWNWICNVGHYDSSDEPQYDDKLTVSGCNLLSVTCLCLAKLIVFVVQSALQISMCLFRMDRVGWEVFGIQLVSWFPILSSVRKW